MPTSFRRIIRSEGRIRSLLGYAALLVVPPLLMLLAIATKFQGFQTAAAMDHAQLARHLADGDGFITSVIRPLSLVFQADVTGHPDLYNAPLHPLVLAFFFQLAHPGDRVTAAVGSILWIFSVWVTYIVARRWFGRNVAALAALFWICNAAGIASSIEGLANPLMAIAVTLSAWVAVPTFTDDGQAFPERLPPWRVLLLGVVCGLALLTHYALIVITVAMAVHLLVTQQRKWRSLLLFGAGFFLATLPWMIRNARVGAPVLGIYWYELLTNTGNYPGDAVWRRLTLPPGPLVFAVGHPFQLLRKLVLGLAEIRAGIFTVVDPVVAFLFLTAVFAFRNSQRRRHLANIILGGFVLGVITISLLRVEPGFLLAWTPLLGVLGAAQLVGWVHQYLGRAPAPEEPKIPPAGAKHKSSRRSALGRLGAALPWSRVGAYALVIGAVVFPLAFYFLVARPPAGPKARDEFRPVAARLPDGAVVMTDQPAPLAWYTDHLSVLLVQHEQELDSYERVLGAVDAFLVTPAITQLTTQERGDWWSWIAASRGVYHGLTPAERMPPNMLLRLRHEAQP